MIFVEITPVFIPKTVLDKIVEHSITQTLTPIFSKANRSWPFTGFFLIWTLRVEKNHLSLMSFPGDT